MTASASLERRGPLATIAAWVQASRLPSQSYIALPLLLGQALAAHQHGRPLATGTLAVVQLFGVLDQLFIVYANDWADQDTDRLNHTPTLFSGGSRVLVHGRLSPRAIGTAAVVCAAGLVALSVALAWILHTYLLVPLAASALALLWAYSYAPLRLSYRGGGEWLQMLGVAGVLPLYGYLAQGGDLAGFPWRLLALLFPTHLACAVATSLPDAPSDAGSDKRTWAVRVGGERAAWTIAALDAVSIALLLPVTRSLGLHVPAPWLLVPLLAAVAVVAVRPAPPGSRLILVRVGAAILVTLSVVALVLLALLGAW